MNARSQSNGSTEVTFSLSNLPSNLSYPLSYFIAENGVPSDGDCYLTGPVFDPAGALSYCNTAYPQACKVGDLSGKHMNVTSNSTGGDYIDAFIAFSSSAPEYFVNRSIVLMDSNSTRLACTNITSVSVGEGSAPSNITRAPSPVTYANVYNQPESNATTSATASGLSASGSGTTASTGTSTSTTTTGASSMLQALSSSSVLVLALISFLTVC